MTDNAEHVRVLGNMLNCYGWLYSPAECATITAAIAALKESDEGSAITGLAVTLFGVECYLPSSVAASVRAACSQAEGMVLVPRVPTYQMAEALGVKWESGEGFPRRYASMLAAAPTERAMHPIGRPYASKSEMKRVERLTAAQPTNPQGEK